MHGSHYNTVGSVNAGSALPPIPGHQTDRYHSHGINGHTARSLAMVSQNCRGQASKSLIYRSVPPKPHTFTLSDMIGDTLAQQKGTHSKKLGLTGSASSEFAKRFMSRPTTQPPVVEFNVSRMSGRKGRRGINGFFPPVKLRGSAKALLHEVPTPEAHGYEPTHISVAMSAPPLPTATISTTTTTAPDIPLQLVPTSYSEVRPKSASRSISRASRTSRMSRISRGSVRKTPESARTAPLLDTTIIYPETFEFDDINAIPSHKKVLPKRDLPWVFRYKVKRNMNELSKIMAKNPQLVDV